MQKIKVLIVDDSVIYRSQIRAALDNFPRLEVVGTASNGRLAIERLVLTPVDLLILDLEMPEMDGIQTLQEMTKRGLKCKVVIFSSTSKRGAEVTMEALRLGANDFIAKPNGASDLQPFERIRALIGPKIDALFPEVVSTKVEKSAVKRNDQYPKIIWDLFKPKIVVIGSSTGGPTVLEKIFSELAPPLNCPIVIAQHMPPVFTAAFAERLSKLSGIPVREAIHGEVLDKNCIYIAPGDYHLRLQGTALKTTITLDQGPQINSVRPAVDPLFSTAAEIFKDQCLGFVLTGMGADGKDGAEVIKQNGGTMIIQDEKSCVVFGMPGAVFSAGAYDRIATPDEIIDILQDKVATTKRLTSTRISS